MHCKICFAKDCYIKFEIYIYIVVYRCAALHSGSLFHTVYQCVQCGKYYKVKKKSFAQQSNLQVNAKFKSDVFENSFYLTL